MVHSYKGNSPTSQEIYSALLKEKSMQTEPQKFDQWAIVELFGHQKIAGKCSEQNIAGTNMLRIDVPETKQQPAFSRLFGSAAIYAINPVDEITACLAVEKLQAAPIMVWEGESFIKKFNEAKPALPNSSKDDSEDFYHEDDDLPM